MDFADNTMWNKLLHKGTADQEPAVFTSTLDARRTSLPLSLSQQPLGAASAFEPLPSSARVLIHESNGAPVSCSRSQSGASSAATTTVCATAQRALYERDMFLVMARPVLETLVLLYDNATEDALVCRILRGIWDFIAICSDFGLQQMLNRLETPCLALQYLFSFLKLLVFFMPVMYSVVHLLCFRSRALLESERRVPLKPHTRNNVLAHKARFKQLQAETGVDLHALVSLDFDALITYPTGPTSDRHHEQAKFMTTAEHAPLQLQASKPEVSWSYSWMIKGELLMRVAFHTAEKSPVALQQDAWSALLMLLSWVRARGALPPSLALVGDDFCLSEIHWQDPLPADCDTPDQCGTSKRPTTATAAVLSPSVYAHRCYLEAYGLALERSAGGRNSADTATGTSSLQQARDAHGGATGAGYSAGGGSAWFGLGFLFSDSQQHGRSHHSGGLLTAPSGTLDLPNLYRNTNASLCVSMTGEPLRPDDEILKLSLERSRPAELIYQQLSPGDAEITSTVLKAALAMLMTMVKQLTATPRAGPVPLSVAMPASQRTVSNSSSVHTSSSAVDAVVDLESSFPVQMLSNQFVSSDVKELDAVMLLEWITHIVVRNDDSISLFWGDLNGNTSLTLACF